MSSERRESNTQKREITYEIVREIGIITEKQSGWQKELNLVSWNGADAKYDLREWAPGHDKMSRGVTLTKDEATILAELLNNEQL